MRSALVLGATGLVGQQVVRQLLARPEYQTVTALVRRPLPYTHPKLTAVIVDFDRLDQHFDRFGVDDLFCCLGTTMKQAGSREAFRRVDFEYPLAAARLAQAAGVQRYLLVSSMGADARSAVFYSRVKGEVEEAVAEVGLPMLAIFRPSLLLGERPERRLGESLLAAVSQPVSGLMAGPLARYRPIQSETVARAMVQVALRESAGIHRYRSDQIDALGAER